MHQSKTKDSRCLTGYLLSVFVCQETQEVAHLSALYVVHDGRATFIRLPKEATAPIGADTHQPAHSHVHDGRGEKACQEQMLAPMRAKGFEGIEDTTHWSPESSSNASSPSTGYKVTPLRVILEAFQPSEVGMPLPCAALQAELSLFKERKNLTGAKALLLKHCAQAAFNSIKIQITTHKVISFRSCSNST
jgi:hypothetical protein